MYVKNKFNTVLAMLCSTISSVVTADPIIQPELSLPFCPTPTESYVQLTYYVTPSAPKAAIRWYKADGTTIVVQPKVNRQVQAVYSEQFYVSEINEHGVESNKIPVTVTINDTTAPSIVTHKPIEIDKVVGPFYRNGKYYFGENADIEITDNCAVKEVTSNFVPNAYEKVRQQAHNTFSNPMHTVNITVTDLFGNTSVHSTQIKVVPKYEKKECDTDIDDIIDLVSLLPKEVRSKTPQEWVKLRADGAVDTSSTSPKINKNKNVHKVQVAGGKEELFKTPLHYRYRVKLGVNSLTEVEVEYVLNPSFRITERRPNDGITEVQCSASPKEVQRRIDQWLRGNEVEHIRGECQRVKVEHKNNYQPMQCGKDEQEQKVTFTLTASNGESFTRTAIIKLVPEKPIDITDKGKDDGKGGTTNDIFHGVPAPTVRNPIKLCPSYTDDDIFINPHEYVTPAQGVANTYGIELSYVWYNSDGYTVHGLPQINRKNVGKTFHFFVAHKNNFGQIGKPVPMEFKVGDVPAPQTTVVVENCPSVNNEFIDTSLAVPRIPDGYTLLWFDEAKNLLPTAPQINKKAPNGHRLTYYVAFATPQGCQSPMRATYFEIKQPEPTTLEIPNTLTINCSDPQKDAKINTWLGLAVANSVCYGSFEVNNNYTAAKNCTSSEQQVRFCFTDISGELICNSSSIIFKGDTPTPPPITPSSPSEGTTPVPIVPVKPIDTPTMTVPEPSSPPEGTTPVPIVPVKPIDTPTMPITPSQNNCKLEFYNAFSVNNDLLNDFFYIDGVSCYPHNSLKVYNRWGKLVFEAQGYNNAATVFRGVSSVEDKKELPQGTYYYIFSWKDAQNTIHYHQSYLYFIR